MSTNTRHGVSLMEMVLVISGCTVILTTSAALIHRAMRAQSESQSFFDVERDSLRLSEQFRRDVHQATAAEVGDQSGDCVLVRLELPGGQITEYRQAGKTVQRTVSEGGHRLLREEYAFTSASEVAIREEDSPRRLILTITSDPRDAPSDHGDQVARYIETPVSVRVEASLSRDWPLAAQVAARERSK